MPPIEEDFNFCRVVYDIATGRIPTGMRGPAAKGVQCFVFGLRGQPFLFAVSSAYAEPLDSGLIASASTQPIPGYAFDPGFLTPTTNATSRFTGQTGFGFVTPASSPVSTSPIADDFVCWSAAVELRVVVIRQCAGAASSDPMQWTDAAGGELLSGSYSLSAKLSLRPRMRCRAWCRRVVGFIRCRVCGGSVGGVERW